MRPRIRGFIRRVTVVSVKCVATRERLADQKVAGEGQPAYHRRCIHVADRGARSDGSQRAGQLAAVLRQHGQLHYLAVVCRGEGIAARIAGAGHLRAAADIGRGLPLIPPDVDRLVAHIPALTRYESVLTGQCRARLQVAVDGQVAHGRCHARVNHHAADVAAGSGVVGGGAGIKGQGVPLDAEAIFRHNRSLKHLACISGLDHIGTELALKRNLRGPCRLSQRQTLRLLRPCIGRAVIQVAAVGVKVIGAIQFPTDRKVSGECQGVNFRCSVGVNHHAAGHERGRVDQGREAGQVFAVTRQNGEFEHRPDVRVLHGVVTGDAAAGHLCSVAVHIGRCSAARAPEIKRVVVCITVVRAERVGSLQYPPHNRRAGHLQVQGRRYRNGVHDKSSAHKRRGICRQQVTRHACPVLRLHGKLHDGARLGDGQRVARDHATGNRGPCRCKSGGGAFCAPRIRGAVGSVTVFRQELIAGAEGAAHFRGAGEHQPLNFRGGRRVNHHTAGNQGAGIDGQGVTDVAEAVARQNREFHDGARIRCCQRAARHLARSGDDSAVADAGRGLIERAPQVKGFIAHVAMLRVEGVLARQGAPHLRCACQGQISNQWLCVQVNDETIAVSAGGGVTTACRLGAVDGQGVTRHARAVFRHHGELHDLAGIGAGQRAGRNLAACSAAAGGSSSSGSALITPGIGRGVTHVAGFRVKDVGTAEALPRFQQAGHRQVGNGGCRVAVDDLAVIAAVGLVRRVTAVRGESGGVSGYPQAVLRLYCDLKDFTRVTHVNQVVRHAARHRNLVTGLRCRGSGAFLPPSKGGAVVRVAFFRAEAVVGAEKLANKQVAAQAGDGNGRFCRAVDDLAAAATVCQVLRNPRIGGKRQGIA